MTGLRLDVVTVFPRYLDPLRESLLGKASRRGLLRLAVHDLREWTTDAHRSVDDSPYGGGPGMVMRPEPWAAALSDVVLADADYPTREPTLVVPAPAGRRFDQETAAAWARRRWLVFACGRYEGLDARIGEWAARSMRVEEVSIGDYVLAGGEAAALVMIEAVARLLPGFMGNTDSVREDSFHTGSSGTAGLLDWPSYTRPEQWEGMTVPAVLRSGDHARIARWRRDQALIRTARRRPDLLTERVLAQCDTADLRTLQEAGFRLPPDLLAH